MNGILALRLEHQEIEYHLIVLEEILDEDVVDYKMLKTVLGRIVNILDKHEKGEGPFFEKLAHRNPDIGKRLQKLNEVHKIIDGHITVLKKALTSKKPEAIEVAMENDGRMLISKIRGHIYEEEKLFDRVLFLHLIKAHPKRIIT